MMEENTMKQLTAKIAFSLACVSVMVANAQQDENKTQIFMDKYLPQGKLENFNISPDEMKERTKDINLSNFKLQKDVNESTFKERFGNLPVMKSGEAEKHAKEVSNFVRTDKFQKGVAENEKYILYDKSIDWSKYTGKYSEQTKNTIEQLEKTNSPLVSKNQYLNSNEKLFIVISSSLPRETIRSYFKTLEGVNLDVTFIMRGVIGTPQKIMPTINYINELLVKNPNEDISKQENRYQFNVEINPKVTRRFDVKEVPAILFIKNYNPVVQEYKEIIGSPDKDETYWIAYGDSSIDYALEEINKNAKSDGIERLLKAIKNKNN